MATIPDNEFMLLDEIAGLRRQNLQLIQRERELIELRDENANLRQSIRNYQDRARWHEDREQERHREGYRLGLGEGQHIIERIAKLPGARPGDSWHETLQDIHDKLSNGS